MMNGHDLVNTMLGDLLNVDKNQPPSMSNSSDEALDQPEPLFRAVSEAEPFPVDCLGEVLAAAAKALIENVKAPDAICGQSILSAAALAAQGHRNIEINGRLYPISENFLTVAMSGERKSGVDKPALKAHVEWEQKQFEIYCDELKTYKQDLEVYKRAKSRTLSKTEDQKAPNRDQMSKAVADLGEPPHEPLSPNLLVEEPTYEGLVKLLIRNQPSIGIFSDEGGRMIGGHAMNQDNLLKTLAGLSNIWDGKPISRSRGGDGTTKLFSRRLSMHLMVQPDVARIFLGNKIAHGQGFMARCLIAWPPSKMGTREYKEMDLNHNSAMQRYWAVIAELLRQPLPVNAKNHCELVPPTLRLSENAKKAWINFYNIIEAGLVPGGSHRIVAAFASKVGEHALRLAGILSVVANPMILEVSEENMQAAIELAKFYLAEATRLHEASEMNPDLVDAQDLLTWIRAKELSVVYPALIYRTGPRSIREKKRALFLIKILEQHRWLKSVGPLSVDGSLRRDVWELNCGAND